MNWDAYVSNCGDQAKPPTPRLSKHSTAPPLKAVVTSRVAKMILLLQTGLPPSNLPFLLAAFIVTGVVFFGYIFFIFRRRQETQNEIDRLLSNTEKRESAGSELP